MAVQLYVGLWLESWLSGICCMLFLLFHETMRCEPNVLYVGLSGVSVWCHHRIPILKKKVFTLVSATISNYCVGMHRVIHRVIDGVCHGLVVIDGVRHGVINDGCVWRPCMCPQSRCTEDWSVRHSSILYPTVRVTQWQRTTVRIITQQTNSAWLLLNDTMHDIMTDTMNYTVDDTIPVWMPQSLQDEYLAVALLGFAHCIFNFITSCLHKTGHAIQVHTEIQVTKCTLPFDGYFRRICEPKATLDRPRRGPNGLCRLMAIFVACASPRPLWINTLWTTRLLAGGILSG